MKRLGTKWICVEIVEQYLRGAVSRFQVEPRNSANAKSRELGECDFYKVPRLGILWDRSGNEPLAEDGGLHRPQ